MAELVEQIAPFTPLETSQPGIDADKRRDGIAQSTAGEQAGFAAAARRFLDASMVYLNFQYTGSRRWYPNGGIFTAPSVRRRPPAALFMQGEKHVVG